MSYPPFFLVAENNTLAIALTSFTSEGMAFTAMPSKGGGRLPWIQAIGPDGLEYSGHFDEHGDPVWPVQGRVGQWDFHVGDATYSFEVQLEHLSEPPPDLSVGLVLD